GYIPYMGEWIMGQEVPWHYLPVWLMITIPLTYQILFVVGGASIVRLSLTKRLGLITDERREEVIFLLLFSTPILALIGIGSTLYNDWRQFYFLYIPFLLVVLYAIKLLWGRYVNPETGMLVKRGLLGFLVLAGVYQAFLGYWMIANHPHQNVFRTTPMVELFGGRGNFDHDSSRSVSRQGFEYVLSIDDSDPLPICLINGTISFGMPILPQADIERIEVVDCE
ncbi:MAG TPA: hypothetical protein PLZ51_28840, partial [Aggregatilineales bacterium]|nr:hypothetical protein [Aggregatilineales bacterium]